MNFTKTTEYAIRTMVFLANQSDQRWSVQQLHKALAIPYKYLARLMSKLAGAGLVDVEQGKNGGYKIGRPLSEIYLYQIVGVVEDLKNYERCVLGFQNCSDENPCELHLLWAEKRIGIRELIFNTSLEKIKLSNQEVK